MSASVTGAAAAALGPEGKFHLAATQLDGQRAELNGVEATQLSNVWVRQFASMVLPFLQETHGSKIDLHGLVSCGRPLYARSAFVPPGDDVPAPYRRPYGPWWLVTYCDASRTPTISVAVSAWATDLTIVNGSIQFPVFSGSEFFPIGIPLGHVGEFPSAPEAAVAFAAEKTGRRVAGVPELVMRENSEGPPQGALWHLVLDKPTTLHGAKAGDVLTSDAFVGPADVTRAGITQFVASSVQPTGAEIAWSPGPMRGEPGSAYFGRMNAERHSSRAMRRVDLPTRLEAVSVGGR